MILTSKINSTSSSFIENKESMLKRVSDFRDIENLLFEKEKKAEEKFEKAGKLLPRERIKKLVDVGSSFFEFSSIAGYKKHGDKDGSMAGGGIIAGIGFVEGTRCLIVANNSAIKGGTISPTGLEKILRLHEIALENRLPLVTLAESGGANLHFASEVYIQGARAFANQARLSAQGIPQLTIVHGNATAGGAYQPGLSDYIILVKEKSQMFLAGPPLLKAATGEIATAEDLGGAEMHMGVSGMGEYLVESDMAAMSKAREVVRSLNWNEPIKVNLEKESVRPPSFDPSELIGITPSNPKTPYDVREIIARVVDGSEFLEFKKEYDSQTVCGHSSIGGFAVGVIGNNGPITAKGAGKAAQFIQLCEQSQTSLIFLHNTTGFMVGTHAEKSGIIKQGSKMIQAVANSTVSKISVLVGGSYGAGNYAMCGRGFDPTFLISWPNSRTAVMGGEQAGKVLRIVSEENAKRKNLPIDNAAMEKLEKETTEYLNSCSDALFTTAQLWDDGLIDPRDTRSTLMLLLETCYEAKFRKLNSNHFGVARV